MGVVFVGFNGGVIVKGSVVVDVVFLNLVVSVVFVFVEDVVFFGVVVDGDDGEMVVVGLGGGFVFGVVGVRYVWYGLVEGEVGVVEGVVVEDVVLDLVVVDFVVGVVDDCGIG